MLPVRAAAVTPRHGEPYTTLRCRRLRGVYCQCTAGRPRAVLPKDAIRPRGGSMLLCRYGMHAKRRHRCFAALFEILLLSARAASCCRRRRSPRSTSPMLWKMFVTREARVHKGRECRRWKASRLLHQPRGRCGAPSPESFYGEREQRPARGHRKGVMR